MDKLLTINKNSYINLLSKIEVLNPITTIKRGYTITSINDKVVTNIKNIKTGDLITTKFNDGVIESEVVKIYEENSL